MIKIIQSFFSYIKTIAVLIFLGVFAELIIPDNNYKKYINLIMGLIVILSLLSPITKMVNAEGVNFDNISIPVANYEKESKNYSKGQKELINDVYKNNLINIINDNMKKNGINSTETEIQFVKENEGYGEIEQITIRIYDKNNDKKDVSKNISDLLEVNEENIRIIWEG